MRKPLTARQQEIYGFIVEEIRQRGIPPTIREIGERFGMRSSNGAREALNAIARKGYIRRHDRLSRGIELVDPVDSPGRTPNGRPVPLVRIFAPGNPHLAQAVISRHLVVDCAMLPDEGTLFAVTVTDDALAASGIHAGDIAIAVTGPPREEGGVVVALAGARCVLRRYDLSESVPLLRSDRIEDGALPLDRTRPDIVLVGHVCGLMRNFANGSR